MKSRIQFRNLIGILLLVLAGNPLVAQIKAGEQHLIDSLSPTMGVMPLEDQLTIHYNLIPTANPLHNLGDQREEPAPKVSDPGGPCAPCNGAEWRSDLTFEVYSRYSKEDSVHWHIELEPGCSIIQSNTGKVSPKGRRLDYLWLTFKDSLSAEAVQTVLNEKSNALITHKIPGRPMLQVSTEGHWPDYLRLSLPPDSGSHQLIGLEGGGLCVVATIPTIGPEGEPISSSPQWPQQATETQNILSRDRPRIKIRIQPEFILGIQMAPFRATCFEGIKRHREAWLQSDFQLPKTKLYQPNLLFNLRFTLR